MNVTELIKKSLAFGLGAAALSAEKLKQFSDEMVARGEMSTDEAKKFMDDISSKAEDEKKTIQTWIQEQVSKMLQQAGAAETAKVEQLELRVAMLERRVAELSGEVEACEASAAQQEESV